MSSRSRLAIGASVGSFVFVALVAATPGSPFSPVLPAPPGGPVTALAELLSPAELAALALRADELLRDRHFPAPDPGYHSVPWPLV